MYNEITHECTCAKCGHSWRSRGEKPPVCCTACTSRNWNSGSRKFQVIVCKACGNAPEKPGFFKYGFLDYVDTPNVEPDSFFYITSEEVQKYLPGRSCPIRSAVIFVGDCELNDESMELKINECKLVYVHEAGYNTYLSVATCVYNIKSYYNKLAEIKRSKAEAERRAIEEEEHKQRLLENARQKLEEDAIKRRMIEEAKQKITDESTPIEEKIKAIAFLEQA